MGEKASVPVLFVHYLYDRRMPLVFYGLTMISVFIILVLNHLNYFSELAYAMALSGFLYLVYGVWDFYRYVLTCRQLSALLKNSEEPENRLPEPKGYKEGLYQELLKELDERRRRLISLQTEQEKERKDYYSMWVHQIKTPIQAAGLLLEREELKKLEVSKGLEEELFKTEQYAEMALQYLRCQSMQDDMLLKEYELSDIVKKAVKKYALFFIHNNLYLHMGEWQIKVLTDEKWLGFVIEQLLSNAVKYTRQGGISVYPDDGAAQYRGEEISACLVLEDSGIGIRKEDLPRIFDKGFTGFNGRMDRKSTGIGLYLCREILRKLAVGIQVESEVGKGTKVRLYFPKQDKLTKL